jgi:hypothetical protein
MARVYAMKHSYATSSGISEYGFLTLGYFIRLAAQHTAFGGVACFAAGLLITPIFGVASLFTSYRFEPILIWKIIGFFPVLYVPVLWFCTICVGCLILIPVEIWRFSHRGNQTGLNKGAPEEGLWDRYLDVPKRP